MSEFTHLDEGGRAIMVDVSDKPITLRTATARARIKMQIETAKKIQEGSLKKGDVLAVAQIAAVTGAKRTADLIPLCHPLPLTGVNCSFELRVDAGELLINATVRTTGQTGVEMEALTAVSVAALTVYDMCKALDRSMSIEQVALLEKHGGASGDYVRPESFG